MPDFISLKADSRVQHALARWAEWGLRVKARPTVEDRLTATATQFAKVSMHLNQIIGSRVPVQPVDVQGDHPAAGFGQCEVGRIGNGAPPRVQNSLVQVVVLARMSVEIVGIENSADLLVVNRSVFQGNSARQTDSGSG